jgi:hypothetical protein
MLDFYEFDQWLKQKYADSYRVTILCYTRKYSHLVVADNLRELDMLPTTIKSNAVKGLIVLSKYLGIHKEFTDRFKAFDIKLSRPDSLCAFLRILNASNSNIMLYYNEVTPLLRDNERLFAKFLLHSGLRMSEAIASFNLIIKLASENKLTDYYDENLGCLMHFKHPKLFIRHTKNCYITFIGKDFLNEIASSSEVTYSSIRKRLEHNDRSMRFNEFRDYFGTHLVNNGILEIEQNLVCGRIPIGIFIRHYWSPKLKELGARVLTAVAKMENTITN